MGNSDHSSLSAVISMAQAVPNLCVSRKNSRNIKSTGIQTVVQYRICPGVTFGLLAILLEVLKVLNEHLMLQVGRYVPTKVIRVRNQDKPWFDDQCRHFFLPQAGGSFSVGP